MPTETVDVEARTRVAVVESAVSNIEKAVERIADSIGQVVRLEDKHAETRDAVGRAFKAIEKAEEAHDKFATEVRSRLGKAEAAIEPLKETRSWIVGGVIGVLAMVGVAVVSVVVKAPSVAAGAHAASAQPGGK